jgi:hypothetical protein
MLHRGLLGSFQSTHNCILVVGDDSMPLKDSLQSEQTERREDSLREESQPAATESSVEEIVTPIEAGAQAQAEHEFETERKIPDHCTCAIVSVNGQDVDQVPMTAHHRAA